MQRLPKRIQKIHRYWLFGGLIIMGLALLWILNPAAQSIIPKSNFDFHPDNDTEFEGIGAKRVSIRVLSYTQVFTDYQINKLSFHVEHQTSDWESEVFSGTSQVVSGVVTVPDNGDYVIRLHVEIYFYDDGAFYTEYQTSRFGMFDPDYAGEEDEEFFSTTYTPFDPPTGEFEIAFPVLPVGGALVVLWRRNRK